MQKKNLLFIAILLISMASCQKSPDEMSKERAQSVEAFLDTFEKEMDLKSEVFLADSTQLLRPFRIKILGDYMFINDKDGKTFYSVYDISKKEFVCRFLTKGKGPNEYLSPYLSNIGEDTIVIVEDNITSKIAFYALDNVVKCIEEPDRVIELERLNKGDVPGRSFPFGNSFILSGLYKENRYYHYDMDGKILGKFGSYAPVSSDVSYDNYHLGFIFSGKESLRSNSTNTRIASVSRTSLSVFSYNNNSFEDVYSTAWFEPQIKDATYKKGKPFVLRMGQGAIAGAGALAATDKYLFFPFSKDELFELSKKGIQDYFDHILVTDWDGVPVAKLKLDKRIQFQLETDETGNYLYSTHVDTESGFSQIIRFDISAFN